MTRRHHNRRPQFSGSWTQQFGLRELIEDRPFPLQQYSAAFVHYDNRLIGQSASPDTTPVVTNSCSFSTFPTNACHVRSVFCGIRARCQINTN